jgi:predicted lipoprotein with Yx(FWY)xxD motif
MRNRLLLIVAALGIAAFAFGAISCGSDSNDNKNDKTPQATSTTEATQPSGSTTPNGTTTGQTPDTSGAFTTLKVTEDATLGAILTTFDGYTVYTFDNDTGGKSTCTGDCTSLWPPLPTAGEPTGGEGVTGELGTITRDDGSTQVTYDGKPLYIYSSDPSPGDTNGDGFGGLWHVVKLS